MDRSCCKHLGFSIVVACDASTGGMGYKGGLPWYIPSDLKRFKSLTTSKTGEYVHALVMGRRTWESLPGMKGLPGRINIVISSKPEEVHVADGFTPPHVCQSLDQALELCHDLQTHNAYRIAISVIGGSSLYADALLHPMCEVVHITWVRPSTPTHYDAFFPIQVLNKHYRITHSDEPIVDLLSGHVCTFTQYGPRVATDTSCRG